MSLLAPTFGRLRVCRLDKGADLLDGVRDAVAQADIRQGVIVAGVGSLSSYHLMMAATPEWPPPQLRVQGRGAFEIASLQGYVMDGEIHAHVVLSNDEKALGGHLERGCEVLAFAIVTIAELSGVDLAGLDRLAD
jgi:predicted DNA-binding protein with PD1-like motif